jgi:hypothetical protein
MSFEPIENYGVIGNLRSIVRERADSFPVPLDQPFHSI